MTSRGVVWRPAIVLFAIMAGHALLETARDALFLPKLGADKLAWAYIAIAFVALGALAIVRRAAGVREPRRLLVAFLAIASLGTGVLAVTVALDPSLAFVLYVWTGVVATLIVPSFWLVVDRSLRVAEAKRLFAAIAAGGSLGALAGSAAAIALARLIATQHLVTVAAAVLGLATIAASVLAPADRGNGPRAVAVDAAESSPPQARRYLRLLLLFGIVSAISLTLGDLMFKRVIAERIEADALAVSFATIYTALNVIGLIVQVAITPRLLDRLGVGATLTILPVLVLASSLGFILTGAGLAVVAVKLADGSLRHSVHRVGSEILFLPLPAGLRDRAKPLVDVIGQRGGQALGAAATLAFATTAAGTWQLAIVTLIATLAWLAVTAVTRAAYLRQFRATLDAGEIQRDVRVPALDGDAVALLTSALASPDEAEAMAALDLLAQRGERIPALVLYHPSPAIVRRALSLIDGEVRPDVMRVLAHLTEHPDPEIRASALAASSRSGCHGERLSAALSDPAPAVRAAAAVGVVAHAPDEARRVCAQLVAGTTEDRVALAHAIARAPREAFRGVLVQLIAHREPAVVREVLRAWERAPALADLGRLMRLLEDPSSRADARRVLVAGGYLDCLIDALDDPRTPLGIRRHLPRTLAQFRSPAAAGALVARLPREPDGTTEFKILRALGRMRADDPALPIDPAPVRTYVKRSLEDAARYRALGRRAALVREDSPALDLVVDLLDEKCDHAIERVFRALGVLYPSAELRSVYTALTGLDDERGGAAREILDELVDADIRVPLLELLDGRGGAELDVTDDELFALLLADPSESLRCIAAHHVAERHLVALRGELVRLKPITGSPLVTTAFEQAIARLDA